MKKGRAGTHVDPIDYNGTHDPCLAALNVARLARSLPRTLQRHRQSGVIPLPHRIEREIPKDKATRRNHVHAVTGNPSELNSRCRKAANTDFGSSTGP